MFENFIATSQPDNRYEFLDIEDNDDIIIGATCTHTFLLPVNFNSFVGEIFHVYYKQGLDLIVTKNKEDCVIRQLNPQLCSVTVKLNAGDTSLFKMNYQEVLTQIKFSNISGDILYTEPKKLVLCRPLDK